MGARGKGSGRRPMEQPAGRRGSAGRRPPSRPARPGEAGEGGQPQALSGTLHGAAHAQVRGGRPPARPPRRAGRGPRGAAVNAFSRRRPAARRRRTSPINRFPPLKNSQFLHFGIVGILVESVGGFTGHALFERVGGERLGAGGGSGEGSWSRRGSESEQLYLLSLFFFLWPVGTRGPARSSHAHAVTLPDVGLHRLRPEVPPGVPGGQGGVRGRARHARCVRRIGEGPRRQRGVRREGSRGGFQAGAPMAVHQPGAVR